jgi:hypothetical protein
MQREGKNLTSLRDREDFKRLVEKVSGTKKE